MEITLATLTSFGKLTAKNIVTLLEAKVKLNTSSTCYLFLKRAMRKVAFCRFGRLTLKVTDVAFNDIYKKLTGDCSAAIYKY